jgi:hypothetical protein
MSACGRIRGLTHRLVEFICIGDKQLFYETVIVWEQLCRRGRLRERSFMGKNKNAAVTRARSDNHCMIQSLSGAAREPARWAPAMRTFVRLAGYVQWHKDSMS